MKVKGTELTIEDQKTVLRSYVHRYTGDRRPEWACKPRPDGSPYQAQFRDDADWLEHTTFAVRKDGRLDRRVRRCESHPTWPNGEKP